MQIISAFLLSLRYIPFPSITTLPLPLRVIFDTSSREIVLSKVYVPAGISITALSYPLLEIAFFAAEIAELILEDFEPVTSVL